jgi:NAD(P)H-hydrate epimerase
MKIFNQTQIREWDAATIARESIKSSDLMERAGYQITNWITSVFPETDQKFQIACGIGNNGGDGLVVSRLLAEKGYPVEVLLLTLGSEPSPDNALNTERLPKYSYLTVTSIGPDRELPKINPGSVVIDAIFGSGLNRPIEGYFEKLFIHMNNRASQIIAIDVPSGMFIDTPGDHHTIKAEITLTLQTPKLSFFFPENKSKLGKWKIIDIGLHKGWEAEQETPYHFITEGEVRSIPVPRQTFDHKGTFGHALLICGSHGKIGAAMLSAKAALVSGAGLVSCYIPSCGYTAMQAAIPEVMVLTDDHENKITAIPDLRSYKALGVGCGIGQADQTRLALRSLLQGSSVPLVIDADALNILSANDGDLSRVPQGSILTPHPREFERLAGRTHSGFETLEKQIALSKKYGIYIVLKRAFTCVSFPDGTVHFNSSGNPGMATAGSGDVLTGLITGLLAQGMAAEDAAIFGVYLHGLAGDLAAAKIGMPSMIASDILSCIGEAYQKIDKHQ